MVLVSCGRGEKGEQRKGKERREKGSRRKGSQEREGIGLPDKIQDSP